MKKKQTNKMNQQIMRQNKKAEELKAKVNNNKVNKAAAVDKKQKIVE